MPRRSQRTNDFREQCLCVHEPLKRATERDSDSTVKTTTALRASQLEETV